MRVQHRPSHEELKAWLATNVIAGGADPYIPEIEATTLMEIFPKIVQDNYFLDTPFMAHLRDHCLAMFGGGSTMQQTFVYAPMVTGSYGPGQTFNTDKRQTIAGTRFDPKYYASIVPEYLEDLDVINRGDLAVFSLLNLDLATAMNSICANVAVALSLHGQPTGAGIVGNRPYDINGWIEAINDGITPGWDGSVFASYGGQARNGAVQSALNSIPKFVGDGTSGATGALTYSILEEAYWDATIGRERPNLGATSKRGMAIIKERIQPAQRVNMENAVDAYFGVTGVKMNDAIILPDDYWPSAAYGVNDPNLGNYLTSTFVVPAGASAQSGLPAAGVTVTVGEVFTWFNTFKWLFRMSASPRYQFGLQGFFPAADSTKVVARIHAMCNLICTAPRQQKQIYGFAA